MNVSELINQLQDADFMIKSVKKMEHSTMVTLGCGAVINAYKTDTVMIQGKMIKSAKKEALSMLRKILPVDTVWELH